MKRLCLHTCARFSIKNTICAAARTQDGYGAVIGSEDETLGFFACEIDLYCPAGSTLYVDDGSEGADSCFTISSESVATWDQAYLGCPANTHLLTFSGATFSALGAAVNQAGFNTWIGCQQSSDAMYVTRDWTWVDGGPADNLNCGEDPNAMTCGVWRLGAPG